MGQQGSVCCCCGRDKRASEVLNDSLQEKLLDEDTNVTVDTRQSRERERLKESKTRHAGVATTDGDDEEARISEQRKANEEIEDDEDQFDELYTTKSKSTARDHTGSSYNTSNAWDLNQDSQVDFESSLHSQQQETSSSDLSGMGARIADLSIPRLESDVSMRSNREDSYASSQEEASEPQNEEKEDKPKEEKTPMDSLRRRSVARPSSSRVFDDEDESRSRGLTELSDQGEDSQGFGSYGSNSSLLQSFVVRDSDVGSTTSFAESQRVIDDATVSTNEGEDVDKPPSPTSRSPRHKHKKKKKGKLSPRAKHR